MKFIIDVPEGFTTCSNCPFYTKENICLYLHENDYCEEYDFNKLNIEEYKNEN